MVVVVVIVLVVAVVWDVLIAVVCIIAVVLLVVVVALVVASSLSYSSSSWPLCRLASGISSHVGNNDCDVDVAVKACRECGDCDEEDWTVAVGRHMRQLSSKAMAVLVLMAVTKVVATAG